MIITTGIDASHYMPARFPSNLKGWWSALDPLANGSLPVDSSTLPSWKDKSANGNNFSQLTLGLMPTFKRSVVNNLAGILFSGGQYMKAPVIATLTHSITCLVQSSDLILGDIQFPFYNGDELSNNGYGYNYDNGVSPGLRGVFYAPTDYKDNGNLTTNFEVITIGWDGAMAYLRVNGINHVITTPTAAPVLPTGNLYLGVDNPDPGFAYFLNGYVCEIIARNSWVLSNVQADEKYIISTYGIT